MFVITVALIYEGTRKALVEKSGLVKHATNLKKKPTLTRQSSSEAKASKHT